MLAAKLISSLRADNPNNYFFGIGGPLMQEQGCHCLFSMHEISVMGVDQLLTRIGHILALRRRLRDFILQQRPAVFVGVDVPDFNLGLEVDLRKSGIPCVHYVSPTVWAWRGYRIHKIARAVDRMLTLFPFEAEFYRRHHIPVTYVGHPLACEIASMESVQVSREVLNLNVAQRLVAVLPGSRVSEVERLFPIFLATIKILAREFPGIRWLIPAVNQQMYSKMAVLCQQLAPQLSIDLRLGQSRRILNASDIALLASGTAALEAALLQTPMVVAYRVSSFTSLLVRIFRSVDYFAMPNHLTAQPVVPEFLQSRASPQRLSAAVRDLLSNRESRERQSLAFSILPELMQQPTNSLAADAVMQVASCAQK